MTNSMSFLAALFASAAAFSFDANAQEFKPQVWVNPGLLSYHFDRSKDHRELNYGLGAEVIVAPNHGFMAGTLKNSESQQSRYLGYEYRPLHWQPGELAVSAGVAVSLVDGYPSKGNKGWFVALLPMLSIEGKQMGANVILIPNFAHGAALALQLKLRAW